MKLFAVIVKDKIGSFAPIELKEQTLKEIKTLKKLNANNLHLDKEKTEELKKVQEELQTAKIVIAEATIIEEIPVFKTKE